MMEHYGVYTTVQRADAEARGLRMIRARWECQPRGDAVKCRYVAQEFKWLEDRDDTFAAVSSTFLGKIVDWYALKKGVASMVVDCISAYYQADQLEPVAVEVPREFAEMKGLGADWVWA